MNNKIEEQRARHIFAGLVDCGLLDCSFPRWWRTFGELEKDPFGQNKVTWLGSLGELGYLATELYGVDRWVRLKCFYRLQRGKLNVRAIQSTLSRIGYKNIPDKYPHLKAILESEPPTLEELIREAVAKYKR